jgi:hypothetical protein
LRFSDGRHSGVGGGERGSSVTDYNAWEALGNQGWGWEGLFPYFKKGTEYIPPPAALVKEYGITWDPEA